MTMAATVRPRAFAVWFKDLVRWNPGSFVQSDWRWPKEFIKPLSVALKVRRIEANIDHVDFSAMPLITIRLDGGMEPRSSKVTTDIKGKLFLAYAGDVVYSKIDVRSGAIGIVPESLPVVAVTNEFPVYEVRKDVALPLYIKLLFRTEFFRRTINSMISGASGRKRVQPTQLVDVEVPLPPLPVQQAIVDYWQSTQARITDAENRLVDLKQRVNDYLHSLTVMEPCERKVLALSWDKLESWDVKSSRAAAFKLANPTFKPLSDYAEEATETVRPKLEPDKDWPVYGVNNKDGVFFSNFQKGADFNAPYKRIRKDWFFHNPTRSSVGSLGIVPEVPEDAITSPEYQVWRIRNGLLTGFAAIMITTEYFIKLIQFNRVGAVKQRLYVDNLLSIPIPEIAEQFQREVADEREKALAAIAEARKKVAGAAVEVEAMILGTKQVDTQ
jgi:hypothetical protein